MRLKEYYQQEDDISDSIDNSKPLHNNPKYPAYQIPIGRPSEYKPEYPAMLEKWFDKPFTKKHKKTFTTKNGTVIEEEIESAAELPTIEGFCWHIGIAKKTLHEWIKIYPDLSDAYVRIKDKFRDFIVQNGITGRYDSRFAQFVAVNDTDMRATTDQPAGGAPTIQVINYTDARQITIQQGEQYQQVEQVSEKLIEKK